MKSIATTLIKIMPAKHAKRSKRFGLWIFAVVLKVCVVLCVCVNCIGIIFVTVFALRLSELI